MILQFSINNYKTFKGRATLSFIASNYDTDDDENVYFNEKYKLRLLKSAVVYGANASGKTKLLETLNFMKRYVRDSAKESQKGDEIDVQPFRLSSDTEKEPSEFEVIFIYEDILYRYGFEVTKNKVVSEWLYYKPKTKEVELFYRDEDGCEAHPRRFNKGRAVIKEGLVRDNALLLSAAAQFNDEVSISVSKWFVELRTLSGLNDLGYKGYTMRQAKDPDYKAKILALLKAADLGIRDIEVQKPDFNKLPENLPKEVREKIIREINEGKSEFFSDVLTTHKKYDASGMPIDNVNFSLEKEESSGTKKFYALTGSILDVLENGFTLVIDELDSKLHPNLVHKIISLFNSKELNPKNAQLIFNTHNTNLLNGGIFRRDQIWFTEKNKYGEARLYSLADFKSKQVKKNEPYEEHYIRGKYGAVPFLGSFSSLNDIVSQHEKKK